MQGRRHILKEQLDQSTILLEDVGKAPKQVIVDLGFRGVDQDNPDTQIIQRGKHRSLTNRQRRWLKRRQAVEPAIWHLKSDTRMDRCWLRGQPSDALHAVLCAVGYNVRWLLRAIVRLGLNLKDFFLRLRFLSALIAMLRAHSFEKHHLLPLASLAVLTASTRRILQVRLSETRSPASR